MEDNLLEPFIYGVKEMMSTMLDIECDPLHEVDANLPTYISGIIHITGEINGQVALSFPAETAINPQRSFLRVIWVPRRNDSDGFFTARASGFPASF